MHFLGRFPVDAATGPVGPVDAAEAVLRLPCAGAGGRLHWSQPMAVTMAFSTHRDVSKTFAAIAKGDGVEVGCFSGFSS